MPNNPIPIRILRPHPPLGPAAALRLPINKVPITLQTRRRLPRKILVPQPQTQDMATVLTTLGIVVEGVAAVQHAQVVVQQDVAGVERHGDAALFGGVVHCVQGFGLFFRHGGQGRG